MPKAEVKQNFPYWAGFTIAGVPSKYRNSTHILEVDIEYVEEKLDSFAFFFDPPEFNKVLAAVKEKYPSLACQDAQVGNAMGATFTQTNCSLKDASSVLTLTRFAGGIKTSALSLKSKRKIAENEERSKQKNKDI